MINKILTFAVSYMGLVSEELTLVFRSFLVNKPISSYNKPLNNKLIEIWFLWKKIPIKQHHDCWLLAWRKIVWLQVADSHHKQVSNFCGPVEIISIWA